MKQPDMGKDNPAAGMTKSMSIMMPLMSFYFCLVAPAGMGLYWATSALLCVYSRSLSINIWNTLTSRR